MAIWLARLWLVLVFRAKRCAGRSYGIFHQESPGKIMRPVVARPAPASSTAMLSLIKWIRLGLALWPASLWYQCAYAQDQAPEPLSALPRLKLEQLSATRERPLFTPGRQRVEPPRAPDIPDVPVVSATAGEAAKPPNIELTGLLEEADVTIVFLRTGSETVILRSGDNFGRWVVVADSKTSVKLTDGAEQMTLNMFKER